MLVLYIALGAFIVGGGIAFFSDSPQTGSWR